MRSLFLCAALAPALLMASASVEPRPRPTLTRKPEVARLNESLVTVNRINTFRIDKRGFVLLDTSRWPDLPQNDGQTPEGVSAGCDKIATLEARNFQPGTYAQQAGFAQGEWMAATYNLTANDFPLQIQLIEGLFIANNTTVVTTTHYTVAVWDGTPTNGQMIWSNSSSTEPGDLPHLVMQPGTSATNVQVSVDPGDPEQIYVYDNTGTHKVTIGFRIDHHHSQSGDPCTNLCQLFPNDPVLCPLPTAKNVFPCTDNTTCNASFAQLNFASQNWLFGVNCGPSGCPSNGGWATFSSLVPGVCGDIFNAGCRPHGDWMMRLTWKRTGCQPGVGACCLPNGTCEIKLIEECHAIAGALYRGDGSVCAEANCPIPTGACCFSNGFCTVLTQATCLGIPGSTYRGHGVACGAGSTCPAPPACRADIATEGSSDPLSGPDGFVTGVDMDVFVIAYFTELRRANNQLIADITDGGGTGGPDGFVTGTDFDKYIELYYAGC